jgi:hypothetical protein
MQYTPRRRSPRVLGWTLCLTLAAASGAWAQPQDLTETEPNSTCAAAQDLTQAALPLTAAGSLQTPPGTPDVDFYRLSATPGDLVRVNVDGRFTAYPLTLEDPMVGVFDSACNILVTGEDWRGPDPQVDVEVPADGILIAAVTSTYDWDFSGDGAASGTYRLRAQRESLAGAITGRLVDGRTGQPLAGANVQLYRCGNGCDNAGGALTDETGTFRFATGEPTTEGPLLAGTYEISAYRYNYLPYEPGIQYTLAEDQELALGDIALTPVPRVGSIRGRVIDRVTGAPLSGTADPRARVSLQTCWDPESEWSCSPVADLPVGADGTWELAAYPDGSAPAPGLFRVYAWAEQYNGAQSASFTVGDGENVDAGSQALDSYPVRLYLQQGCGEIPSTGGTCKATVRIVNGLGTRLKGESWSIVNARNPDFGGSTLTTFQAGLARPVFLAPAASTTIPLEFTVPAGVEDGTSICGQTVVAPRANRFETFGTRFLFCLNKGVQGFAAVPEAQKGEVVRKVLGQRH